MKRRFVATSPRTMAGHAFLCALLPATIVHPRPASAMVVRGPYLQNATANAISIRWRTDTPSDSRVRHGIQLHNLTQTVDNPALVTEHEVRIGGLHPNQRYYYAIGTAAAMLAGDDDTTYFHTNPIPGDPSPIRVWAIGDAGTGTIEQRSVRTAFESYTGNRDPDLWLMLGDNAYPDGDDADYTYNVFAMYRRMMRRTCLWATRGNHDLLHPVKADYYDHFTMPTAGEAGGLPSGTEAYYSFDFGNIHFVCLDSEGSDRSAGGAMLSWLRQDIAATTRTWNIAYWHHPPYSRGSHDSDDPQRSSEIFDMRENVLPILDSTGVDVVLTGHSHSYERSFLINGHYGTSGTLVPSMVVNAGTGRPQGGGPYVKPTTGSGPFEGAVYVVAGSSGKTGGGFLDHPVMVESFDRLGSFVIDVHNRRLDAHFVDDTGAAIDSFTILKGPLTDADESAPSAMRLSLTSENPTDGFVRMNYSLPRAGHVRVDVVDLGGRLVTHVEDTDREAGDHPVFWDGRGAHGTPLASGVYFAVLESAGERRAVRVVLAR